MNKSILKTECVNTIMKMLKNGRHENLSNFKMKEIGIPVVYTSDILMERVLRRKTITNLYEIRRVLAYC